MSTESREISPKYFELTRWHREAFAGVNIRDELSVYLDDSVTSVLEPYVKSETETQKLELSEADKATLQDNTVVKSARQALDKGVGFVIFRFLEHPESTRFSNPELARYAFLFNQVLGIPIAQHLNGQKVWDVKDVGGQIASGARFSTTNLESGFHNDGSDAAKGLDYVVLLCFHRAMEGGISQITCGNHVVDLLKKAHPASYEAMATESWWMDKRGGLLPGEAPAAKHYVFKYDAPEDLAIRYHRTWIEHGHEHMGVPLTAEQIAAMDHLDALQHEDGVLIEFYLERGDLIFLNNLKIFHNRTEFKDFPEEHKKRHLLRYWLHRY